MGCLDDGCFIIELENGLNNGCSEVGKDASAIEDAVKVLLLGLGEDINRKGIRKTPLRVAKALREGTRGCRQMVKCHVGYVPSGERVVGLSKLSCVADVFAKRLQDPQCLTNDVCSALHRGIKPVGVAIILQCTHIHFPDIESIFFESNHQGLVKTLLSVGSGVFEKQKCR